MLISDHDDFFFFFFFFVFFFYTIFGPFKIILVHMRRVNQYQEEKGRTLRKRTCTPKSRTWFMSPVIVRLINWAATYGEEFIVLVLVVAKTILLR